MSSFTEAVQMACSQHIGILSCLHPLTQRERLSRHYFHLNPLDEVDGILCPFLLCRVALYLPPQEDMNATNANGLFSNVPIDSNDEPAGNNQQVIGSPPRSSSPSFARLPTSFAQEQKWQGCDSSSSAAALQDIPRRLQLPPHRLSCFCR